MKKIFLFVTLTMLYLNLIFAQASSDSSYNKKITAIESKISEIKNLPKEEQKQYFAALADIENRKNTLKSLLKTPDTKRDKAWENLWNENYLKVTSKLQKISLK